MNRLKSLLKNFFKDKDERNLVLHIAGAFFIKGLSLVLSVFSTPLYIKFFNNNTALGIWYTILSVLSWISICDLGLSNGLRNRLAEALAKNDRTLCKRYVSSTYVILSIIVIPIVIIGDIVLCFLDLNTMLGVSTSVISASALRTGVIILFTGIGLNFIIKTINSVFYAAQQSSFNNFLALISSFLPFFFVLFFDGGSVDTNFISLAIVHSASMILPLLVATVITFKFSPLKDINPSVKSFDMKTSLSMFSLGIQFFFAQLFFLVLMSTNELLITTMFSADNVVEYNAYYRLFSFAGSLFALALTPIWSKVTMDIAKKKYGKLKKTRLFLYGLAGLALLLEYLMVPVLQIIMNLWLGENSFDVSYTTALCFALFGGMHIVNSVLTTIANGIGDLKSQMVFYGIGAVLKVPVIIILRNITQDWNVVVLYTGLVLAAFCIFQFIWTEIKIKKLVEEN